MTKNEILSRWQIKDSEELYGIKNWGASYFSINDDGEITVRPFGVRNDTEISLMRILDGIQGRGFDMPVLLRFENILDSQVTFINEAFSNAMKEVGYRGEYRGVYPVKVNQQQQVLEEVAKYGERYHHGFEVGSKAELIAVMSELTDTKACMICNGYKDEEFIDLGLYAIKLGFQCFFVVEIPGEVDLIIKRSEELGIRPNIGVRIKLSSRAGGHWTESGGDRSIFGLDVSQLITVVDRLKETEMLDCLRLLHYHLGSQIPNIRDIRSAVVEASRIYSELVKEGAPMGYLDIGGGLAVDYDGSKTNYINSRNYSVSEYCADVIEVIMEIMEEQGIEHPTVISESGRALVAYYSVLVFNILDTSTFSDIQLPVADTGELHEHVAYLKDVLFGLNKRNMQESYNDAVYYRDQLRDHFKHGSVTLRERSMGESYFWQIIQRIAKEKNDLKQTRQELDGIEDAIADTYYGNFSLFQSLTDSWAIEQLFPIMPLHRLNERPDRNAIIADITCDCDGKIDRFINEHDVSHSLPLHAVRNDEEYYVGIFLVGAYQETLGDLHNLFGDTNVVSIRVYEDGDYDIVREIEGDSVEDVLSYVEYDSKRIIDNMKKTAERAIRRNRITVSERRQILRAFESGLRGYTYYEK
ncbi:MAG: biosynthetic arginine decarboxylase [Spirochaetota bacterium]